ncbi:hypothetical protein FSP39_024686 [Pinctada imbricata]|uniref:Amino acid transporter n=1 Tax=Pinctada imbricata TaxID=66713 RepID=A0AA88YF02_PINIB|nr:hypothetical protein FSP39_024686 [Pinctada imbricata]
MEREEEIKTGKCLKLIKDNLLVLLTMVGVGLGFALGFGVRSLDPSKDAIMWLGICGELYLRMLKMMIVPLIIASVITGTASMDPKSNGRISVVCFTYIIITNFLPTILGSVLVLLITPGSGVSSSALSKTLSTDLQTQDIFADLLRNLFPENLVSATFEQAQTKYEMQQLVSYKVINGTNITATEDVIDKKSVGSTPSTNILGLVIVSTLFGIATSFTRGVGIPFFKFFESASEVILQILRWLIWTTPVGVISLIAKTIAETKNLEDDFQRLGMYFLTVMTGLIVFMLIFQPITYFIVRRRNPFKFLFSILQPTAIVFATSSTAIAIPETLKSLERKNNLDPRVTRFVVPLSAALGRCGSSMYITVSCLFVTQMVNVELDAAKVVLVCILTTFSTLAIPSVTGASLVTVIILLTALNIPAEAASLLYAVEWFLDRFRSVVNYYVQTLGVVITYEVNKSVLPPLTRGNTETPEEKVIANGKRNSYDSKIECQSAEPPLNYEEDLTHM